MHSTATILRLQNSVQEYDWGSRTSIAELLGAPVPSDKPQAELWMGAHPKAPSRVLVGGASLSLAELIRRDPAAILGPEVAGRFSGRLPFLFKILAAALPLSIQAHPNRQQAREGFRRENEAGIDLRAFQRNYRDDNHKPEMLSALTPFWALSGFREASAMLKLLEQVGFRSIAAEVRELRSDLQQPWAAAPGLKRFFASLLSLEQEKRQRATAEAVQWALGRSGSGAPPAQRAASPAAIAGWILKLHELHPGDIGVLSPLLLNLVLLQPGEAMFMEAGVLHAYLEGTGIELMANSDNVIRGGLTAKHIDVQELLAILRFEGREVRLLPARELPGGELLYQSPAEEFCLSRLSLSAGTPYRSSGRRSLELLLCLDGRPQIRAAGSGAEALALSKGDSLLVPAALPGYEIRGESRLYKASVPPVR